MSKGNPRALPRGITPKTRTKNGKTVPVFAEDGTPVYRVRVWDAVLKKQIERTARASMRQSSCWRSSTRPNATLVGSRPNA